MGSLLRTLFISTVLITSACKNVSDQTDYEYLDSWDVQAITLQNRISQNAPLRVAEFPATHNSFNAKDYSNGISYPDPNHIPSMLNQLRMGKRMINMDLHWDVHYNKSTKLITTDVVLCHDSSDFGFCSLWDRTFDEGLLEIKPWLEENDEVVILKLQDELDGHYAEALTKIEALIGDLVYTPSTPCETFDLEIAKQDILALGKKIIITGATSSTCNLPWGRYVFFDEGMFGSVDYESFEPYPVCNDAIDDIQRKIYKSNNDGTAVSQIILGSKIMTAGEVSNLAQCGVTGISFEPMEWWDERHRAQIWSWDLDLPADDTAKNCALQQANGRFADVSCNGLHAYACQHPTNRDWRITNTRGTWSAGAHACSNEYGSDGYAFSTPANGYENAELKRSVITAQNNNPTIWMNYSDSMQEGNWIAH
ncbi:hypothetical protein A9Q99_21015 [Gammaproteobacteria bacterium 45_16_T64]|nr:hypothetical protein A9Q99_21015 [Gammaproteobacteria bacterium 45_16_T64]